jgi:hypothetical protein
MAFRSILENPKLLNFEHGILEFICNLEFVICHLEFRSQVSSDSSDARVRT